MKRRSFMLTSGSAVLSGVGISGLRRSAFALEFELNSIQRKNPSSTNSVLIDFLNFNLTPRYIDDTKDVQIDIEVKIGDYYNSVSKSLATANGKTITSDDLRPEIPVVVDNIDTTKSSIDGEVIIKVEHSSIGLQTYSQRFTVEENPLVNNIVAYYPVEKGAGSVLHDASNDYDANIKGAAWSGNSNIGSKSLEFDGSDDYVDTNNSNVISSSEIKDSFTVSAWIKLGSDFTSGARTTNKNVIIGDVGSNKDSFSIITKDNNEDGDFNFRYFTRDESGNGNSVNGSTIITSDKWYHVVCTYRNGNQKLYLDADEDATADVLSGNIVDKPDSFKIGYGGITYSDWFDGSIDEIRIYNRALSKDQIQDLYNLTSPSGSQITENEVPSNSDGGVSRYKFQNDVKDSWSSNNGTDNTSSTSGYIQGVYGKAKYFNGNNDHISVNFGGGSEIIYTDWTVSGWINSSNWADPNRKEWLSVNEDRTTSRPLDFVHKDGAIKHYRGEAAGEVMSYDVSNKQGWHQMVVTQNRVDSNTVKLKMYFDGNQVDSDSGDYENMRPSLDFDIGRSIQDDLYWDGGIDDIRIYNRKLAKSEVQDLFSLGSYKLSSE